MLNRIPVLIHHNPTIEQATQAVVTAISERKMFIVAGNCRVNYHGRASSTLETGERILIVKADRSVLIHRPKGYEPINWQPSGCILNANKKENLLFIRAVRCKPSETLAIHFDKVYLVAILSLIDRGEFLLNASEKDMQKAILLQPSIVEKGLKTITHEKKIEPGFIDVYGMDNTGKKVVIEIKRRTA
ncbi:unnamed protein product, partial [marine sediment metagenome]